MKACAYVVGPEGGSGAALRDMARQVGFDSVQSFVDVETAERQAQKTPLLFFLFAATGSLRAVKRIAEAVRASDNRQVKFSPMVYFAGNPSLDAIRACINMGFDDVITLPFTLSRVVKRLRRQVDQPLVYFETSTYFGPDRRDRMAEADEHVGARGSGGQFRRMEIVRNPATGVNLVSDEMQVVL